MQREMWEKFRKELKDAIKIHYELLKEKYPDKNFYGYSLYTSDEVHSIGPVANSIDCIKKQDTYYKCSPDEWRYYDDYGVFDKVNIIINEIHEKLNVEFEDKKEEILTNALDVMEEIENSGFFGEKVDERFLIIWISDSAEWIMDISAERLNTEKVFREYYKEFSDF